MSTTSIISHSFTKNGINLLWEQLHHQHNWRDLEKKEREKKKKKDTKAAELESLHCFFKCCRKSFRFFNFFFVSLFQLSPDIRKRRPNTPPSQLKILIPTIEHSKPNQRVNFFFFHSSFLPQNHKHFASSFSFTNIYTSPLLKVSFILTNYV